MSSILGATDASLDISALRSLHNSAVIEFAFVRPIAMPPTFMPIPKAAFKPEAVPLAISKPTPLY
jgi:hypothetical protein